MIDLRPTRFEDIIGQREVIERLEISVKAAIKRNEALPNVLLDGPPGVGKTTIATTLKNELSVDLQTANGANLRSIKALLPYLMRTTPKSIFFIDEIHRCTAIVQEFLYPILEDFRCDLGHDSQMTIELPEFTVVGATTEGGSLAAPLYDRFVFKYHLSLYKPDDLKILIGNSAKKLGLTITDEACQTIAKTSRGTPRIANARLKWARDFALSHDKSVLDNSIVMGALTLEGIGLDGMDANDRKYMEALRNALGPMGLKSLAAATSISVDTIEQTIEPFLIRQGLIKKTSKGRMLC